MNKKSMLLIIAVGAATGTFVGIAATVNESKTEKATILKDQAPPVWIVSSTGTVARAEAGRAQCSD